MVANTPTALACHLLMVSHNPDHMLHAVKCLCMPCARLRCTSEQLAAHLVLLTLPCFCPPPTLLWRCSPTVRLKIPTDALRKALVGVALEDLGYMGLVAGPDGLREQPVELPDQVLRPATDKKGKGTKADLFSCSALDRALADYLGERAGVGLGKGRPWEEGRRQA
jgi:hypothetical protein